MPEQSIVEMKSKNEKDTLAQTSNIIDEKIKANEKLEITYSRSHRQLATEKGTQIQDR